MPEIPSKVDDVIVGYLDGLFGEPATDWDSLLQQAVDQAETGSQTQGGEQTGQQSLKTAAEDDACSPDCCPDEPVAVADADGIVGQTRNPEDMQEPVPTASEPVREEVAYVSIQQGMAMVSVAEVGAAPARLLPLQLLDSLFLVRHLPAGTRLHALVLGSCRQLNQQLHAARLLK